MLRLLIVYNASLFLCCHVTKISAKSLTHNIDASSEKLVDTATIVQDTGKSLSLCRTCQSCVTKAHRDIEVASGARDGIHLKWFHVDEPNSIGVGREKLFGCHVGGEQP